MLRSSKPVFVLFFFLYVVIRYTLGRIFKIKTNSLFAKDKYKIIDCKNALLLPEGLVTAVACCLCFHFSRSILYTCIWFWSGTYDRKRKQAWGFLSQKVVLPQNQVGSINSGKIIIDILLLEFGKRGSFFPDVCFISHGWFAFHWSTFIFLFLSYLCVSGGDVWKRLGLLF